MNVRVEAGPFAANAAIMESKLTVEHTPSVVIKAPVVSRFSLASVISIGGNSISSITPQTFNRGVLATA